MSEQQADVDLAETLALKVDEIDLAQINDAQLAELRKLEAADGTPRKTLLAAIDAETATRAEAAAAVAPKSKKAKAAPAEVTTMDGPPAPGTDAKGRDFKHPDFDGLLTIPQAEWRKANLKPGGVAVVNK